MIVRWLRGPPSSPGEKFKKKYPVIGNFHLMEIIAVSAWYVWWQRRETFKGESILAPARSTTFAMQALTTYYNKTMNKLKPREVKWESLHLVSASSMPMWVHVTQHAVDNASFPHSALFG